MEKKSITKQSLVSYAVFLVTLVIVLISIISIIFPALIVRVTSPIQDDSINPFEFGVLASPFFIANFILLVIGIIYYAKKLPRTIQQSINLIYDFELSRRMAFVVFGVLIAIYVVLSAGELANEEGWDDYVYAKIAAEDWKIGNLGTGFLNDFKYFLLHESLNIFGNIRLIPFIASILLLLLTCLATIEISGKRFSGIVAMIILLQSNMFLSYDTTASYANFWILLYLLSLYLIYKRWYLSPIAYTWSVFSKSLTAVFFPMTLFFIYRSDIARKMKIRITILYAILLVCFVIASIVNVPLISSAGFVGFDQHDFWSGFSALAFQLRFDALVLIFVLPLTIGLFIASRKGVHHADSVMILIMGTLLSAPLLSGVTDVTIQPYRFVALVVFFAMGAGTILSKKITNVV